MLNLDALSEFSRPVAVELFGHGRSPAPDAHECYAPPHCMTEFERIREHLGAERWFLCGQSIGASLAIRYALERPQRAPAPDERHEALSAAPNAPLTPYASPAKGGNGNGNAGDDE